MRIDTFKYGTNRIGRPTLTNEGTWVRFDLYTSFADNRPVMERRFAADRSDDSPVFLDGINGHYDSRCACCYLNFSHTIAEHKKEISRQ